MNEVITSAISAIDLEKYILGGKEYTQEEKFINDLQARQLFAKNAISNIDEFKLFFNNAKDIKYSNIAITTIYEYDGFSDKSYFAYWMGEILNCLFPKEYISNTITKKFLNEDERLTHYLILVIDHSQCIYREDFDYEDNLARENSDSDKCSGLIWDILRVIYPT